MHSGHIHGTRNSILEQVKRMIWNHLSGKAVRVFLFGSWARSEEKRSSDIDVAIEFEINDELNHRIIMDIRDILEESTIPYKVDVVHLNAADDFIVEKVKKEGILWEDPMKE